MRTFFISLILLISISVNAQKKDETNRRKIEHQSLFGINISPIFPGNFIRNTDIEYASDTINYQINLQNSMSFGAEIRYYFTYRFAMVTGIQFTRRNIKTDYSSQYPALSKGIDTTFSKDLKFIAYEIPIHALGYVRLSNKVYMSIAGGFNLNFYPTHIKVDNVYMQRVGTKIGRKSWQFFQLGYTANVGWEYRTKNSGIFYLGASYQARFDKMARIAFYEGITIHRPQLDHSISGDYFSINLKYFFPYNEKNKNVN